MSRVSSTDQLIAKYCALPVNAPEAASNVYVYVWISEFQSQKLSSADESTLRKVLQDRLSLYEKAKSMAESMPGVKWTDTYSQPCEEGTRVMRASKSLNMFVPRSYSWPGAQFLMVKSLVESGVSAEEFDSWVRAEWRRKKKSRKDERRK
jgi:hypothetical protein